jgi:succinyl-diaminopimelate desuccinylase
LVDEECGQTGSRGLVEKGFRADFAIVGEPTTLKVVTAHKGDLWLRLETRGKAAHGSRPELGRNAILEMAKAVQLLEESHARELRKRLHPLLGSPTISVGTISGGAQPNIVPDHCSVLVDRRTIPGETETTVRRELARLFAREKLNVRLASSKSAPCVPLETQTTLPWVRDLMRVARQKKPLGVDYFCDASVFAAGGIPSVVFGPGDIAHAHTAEEWISLRSLERGTDMLFSFLESLP